MSSWMTDAAAVQNHNGAAFNHDPSMGGNMVDPAAFMGTPNNFIDPSQFQNPQLQQRMQNGGMRNSSPGFNQPVYQTNPVVPSKRPRPREESLGTSPRQTPGMLPNSRSQTPQQGAYTGFQGNQPVQHPAQPTPYSHLQHNGSANASPSPVMGNQMRPGAVPQRVSTASPHPFSPAVPQFAPQGSPSQSDHSIRADTPQNPYMQNPSFAPGFNQNFTPPQGRAPAPVQGGLSNPQMPPQMQSQMAQMQTPQMYAQQQQQQQQQQQPSLEQQKMMYQMRLQQQLQQGNLQRMQGMPHNPNAMNKPQMPAANGQYPQGRQPQQPMARPNNNPEQFMKHLTSYMQSRNLPLDMNPIVGDRPISLVVLYMAVLRFGGYRNVNQQNLWPRVAEALQFNPNLMQNQSAPQQIKGHYERNLMLFEEAYATQQRQKVMMQRNAGASQANPQMSPSKQMNPQSQMNQTQQYMQRPPQPQPMQQPPPLPGQHAQSTPVKQMALPGQPAVNGFSTPQLPNQPQQTAPNHARNSLSRSVDIATPQNGPSFPVPSPVSAGKPRSLSFQPGDSEPAVDASQQPEVYEIAAIYDPNIRTMDKWGGIDPVSFCEMGQELERERPNVPSVMDLGTIDIHALTMSIQSGIHAEVRLALDTLATISVEPRLQLDLKACEDLVETIIDCAEIQLELLAENAAEVSDDMLISSYEDVVRGGISERQGLQDTPCFGTLDYDLDRSVERLICITTILRNLSFYETNHPLLADGLVIKFFCIVIRYLGTRNMLLRTHCNTLDFMKDVIIFLSNLSQAVEIPGKEQALCLLHFLLAFAPCPPPTTATDKIVFSPYDPSVHRYLPPAVDSLAKLLARDEPNRTFYKAIFASDNVSSSSFELLTKTFALAISPIPGQRRDEQRGSMMQLVDARKPHLMQGMLAAEILSNLVPGFETNVARSWLTSEDGFAQSLLRLITVLSSETSPQAPVRGSTVQPRSPDDDALLHITLSGITVLRRLSEKSRDPEDPTSTIPTDGMIKQENLLGALLLKPPAQPKAAVIKQLCAYASLDR